MFPQPGTGMGAGFGANAPAGGGGSANREVRYKVTVTADTQQANQQLQQLASTANQTSTATQQASAALNQMRQGGGAVGMAQMGGGQQFNPYQAYLASYNQYLSKFPGAQPIIQPGAGGAKGGGGMEWAAGLTKFTAAVAGVTAGLSLLENAMRTVSDFGLQSVSARNKYTAGLSRIPLIGGVLADSGNLMFDVFEQYDDRTGGYGGLGRYNAARDRIANAPFDIARSQIYAQQDATNRQAELDRRVALGDVYGQRVASKEAASIMFAPASGPFRFDAEDGYDQTIRRAQMDRARAGAGLMGAQNAVGIYGTEQGITRRQFEGSQFGFQRSMADVRFNLFDVQNNPTNKVRAADSAADAQKQLAQYTADLQRYQEAVNRAKESSLRLAQQEYELAQKTVGVRQAELDVVNAKRERLKGYMVEYGVMEPLDREALISATQRAKGGGFESLSPEEKRLLLGSGITGDFARDEVRKQVAGDDSFTQLLKLVGLEDMKTLERQRLKLQGEIEFAVKVNADQFYDAIKAAFDKFDPELKRVIGEATRVKIAEQDIKKLENMIQNR